LFPTGQDLDLRHPDPRMGGRGDHEMRGMPPQQAPPMQAGGGGMGGSGMGMPPAIRPPQPIPEMDT